MKKSILVTGCAGFIGSNFVNIFAKRFPKVKIIGLDDLSTGRKEEVSSKITFYEGSILDKALLKKIFKKHAPEYVFHFAALPRVSFSVEEPAKTTEVNILGTVTLLEACRDHKVRRFILSSSSSVYGGAKKLPTKEKENAPNPVSPYALQKYVDELFCSMFTNLYGIDTVCLRYFNVYGPGQYGDSAYSTVISAWLEGLYFPKKKTMFLEGDGKQSRDFAYVDNVVEANIKAMQFAGSFKGEAFNIAQNQRINLLEVKDLLEKITGQKLLLEKRAPRKGDVKHTHADISKAKKWFGYEPKVSFEVGLRRTVAWYDGREK
jgi:nucleoside-diphosphate-sugar epimerase